MIEKKMNDIGTMPLDRGQNCVFLDLELCTPELFFFSRCVRSLFVSDRFLFSVAVGIRRSKKTSLSFSSGGRRSSWSKGEEERNKGATIVARTEIRSQESAVKDRAAEKRVAVDDGYKSRCKRIL